MMYCLRCNKPCSNPNLSGSEPSVFCDECRSLLHNRLQPGNEAEAPKDFDLLHTSLWYEEGRFVSSPQVAPSSHTQLTTLQSPGAAVQRENPRSQISLVPESEQGASTPQRAAWPAPEEDSRESNVWTNQSDPLMARLDTYKFPSVPVEQEGMESKADRLTHTSSPIVQGHPAAVSEASLHKHRRGVPRYIRIALVVLAILVALALAVNGVIAFMGVSVTQQRHAQTSTSSPMLTATASTAQSSPTAQSAASPSTDAINRVPTPGAAQPTATASQTSTSPTPAPSTGTATSATPATPAPGTSTPTTSVPATPTPTPQPPVESVSPSALTFSATQGQANPSGQAIKIANTGGTTLNWTASVDSSATSWLSTATSKGTVASNQTGQVMVNVNIAGLTPGSYSSNVTITATDSSGTRVQGSPHVVSVTLTVAQQCTLQVTSTSLSFAVSVPQPNSSGQTITLTETGNCALPISWTASADHSWIILSTTSGKDSGSGSTITVRVNGSGLLPGQYQGHITISALDSRGVAVQGSPQTVSITLTVSLL